MGSIFVVNWIKIRKKYWGLFGPYALKYHYTLIQSADDASVDMKPLPALVGQIIEDVWEKYY